MHKEQVVIIGAGAAGLAAALELGRAGIPTTVIEGRRRIGGRAYSVDAPGCSVPIELGAEFIHGRPAITLELLRRYGLPWVDTAAESWVRSDGGLVSESAGYDAEDALLKRALAATPDGEDQTVEAALRRIAQPADADALAGIRAMVAGFDAADPARASIRAITAEWQGDAGLNGDSGRIVGGYRALWQAMAAELAALPVRIRLGCTLEQIDTTAADAVAVSIRPRDGEPEILAAEYVILTAPLGVLKAAAPDVGAISWVPPLPAAYAQAFINLEAGPVLKAALTFTTPFWERLDHGRYRAGAFFRAPHDAPFTVLWTVLPLHAPILYAWAGGPPAQRLMDAQSALVPAALTTIGAVFGPEGAACAQAELSYAHCEDWQREPYSRGAYSYVAAGGMGARAVLSEPLARRVYFAGEAYADGGEGGTVAGALQTGTAAGRAVVDRAGAIKHLA